MRKNILHHFPQSLFFNLIYVYVAFLYPQSSLGDIEREYWPEMGYNNPG